MSKSQSIKAQGNIICNIANKLRELYEPPQLIPHRFYHFCRNRTARDEVIVHATEVFDLENEHV